MEKAQILIVENDGIIASDLQNRLEGFGFSVPAIVSSGEEAIQKIKENNPDLVVMDIVLDGEMDGIEAAGQIRSQFNIPVIYLTAYTDDNLLKRAKITEPFGYIIKPFEDRELHSSIEIALYKHKAEEALQKAHDSLEQQVKERTAELVKSNEMLTREIIERKKHESKILHLARVLKSILNIDYLIVREKDPDKFLQAACKILADVRGYRFVWVGFIAEGHKKVIPVAQAGFEEGYLKSQSITWDDTPRGKGPTGTAIKTRKPSVMQNFQNDPRYVPWREAALERGYQSGLALPILAGEYIYGALNIYSIDQDAFDTEEIKLLTNVADNIGHAIRTIDLEKKRKKMSKELQESEEKYRLLLKNLPSVVYTGYRDWSVEFIDRKLELLTGYDADEFNTRRMKWSDIIVKEDIKTAKESFIQALKTDKSYIREYRIRAKAGEILWIQERGHIICDKKGEIEYISGIFFDITERKRIVEQLRDSELLLRNTFQSLEEAVLVVSQDRKLVSVNDAAQRMFGYSPEELKNLPTEVLHVDHKHYLEFGKLIKEAFDKGETASFEFEAKRKNGEIFPTEHTVSFL